MRAVHIALIFFGILVVFGTVNSAFAVSQLPGTPVAQAAQNAVVKSYADWKTEKIQSISNKILSAKNQAETLKLKKKTDPALSAALADSNISYYEKMAQQEQWNLEVAQELSISDYLVLYLAAQGTPNRYQEAASKLTLQDVSELMEAYVRALGVNSSPAQNQALTPRKLPLPTQAIQAKDLIK